MAGLSFAFDTSKGETPATIAQKRALVAQLMGSHAAPTTLGAGFSALGDGIVANVTGRRADEGQAAGQSQVDAFTRMLTGSYGAPGATPTPATTGAPAAVPQGGDAASIRQGLIDRGLPEHVADGFLMNFQDESGLNSGINEQNPTVAGSRGGYGLYQLTGPRRVAYEQYAQQRGVDPSDTNAQLDFMMSELQGPEAKAAQSIMAAPDAGSAAAAIARDFLRPAPENLAPRVAKYTGGGLRTNVMAPRTEIDTAGFGVRNPDGSVSGRVGHNPIGYSVYDPQGAQPTQVASLDPSMGAPAQVQPQRSTPVAQAAPAAPATPAPAQVADGGLSMQQLMQAAGNPFVMAQYGDVINSMISQQMQTQQQANDPMRQQQMRAGQLGIEKSQLELDAMRNPGKKAPIEVGGVLVDPDTFQPVFDSRQPSDNGFTLSPGQQRFDAKGNPIANGGQAPSPRPMTPEDRTMWGIPASDTTPYYLDENGQPKAIGGGGQTINVGQGEIGSIPPDYELITDPVTGARSMQIIPGSPSDRKAQADAASAQSTADANQNQASRYGNVVVEDIDRALGVLAKDPTWSTGLLGQAMGNFKGSNSDRLNNLLDTVRANSAFDRLQAMRNASPTGGALGAVSERELGLLQSAIGSLETGNADDLAYNLKRLQTIYSDIIDGPKASTTPAQAQPGDIDSLLQKYGVP